ncbi:hypothetical protein [Actinomadura atramentaria]|uniref:hypothetical protein n=1 Tax=Actinomadura atramentaria TaxID=1990 RepID=UPI000364D5CD|nr:hypothetical protein [Actinomadura atramentaria]
MPRSVEALARRRAANRAAHYRHRRDCAYTTAERVAVAYDHWKVLLAELDEATADAYRAAVLQALETHIAHLDPTPDPPQETPR